MIYKEKDLIKKAHLTNKRRENNLDNIKVNYHVKKLGDFLFSFLVRKC